MNHSIVEALGIAAAVVLMALVVIFGFRAYQSGQDTGNNALAKMESVNSSIDESEYTQYDGSVVSGSSVYQAIRTNTADTGVVYVVKNVGGTETTYNPADSNYSDSLANANKKGEATYITPSGKFLGSVVRSDTTKQITEVHFEQQ